MSQSPQTVRIVLRWVHIILGLIILCYIYSPLGDQFVFQMIVKFFIVPVLVISGVWLWKFAGFNRFFRIK